MWPFKDKEIEKFDRFIDLIKENSELGIRINKLYEGLYECGHELYRYTGNVHHTVPEYWIKEKI